MPPKVYRISRWKRVADFTLRTFIVGCLVIGVGLTGFVVYGVGKFYIIDKPALNRQKREYYEALILKEKREKELGLRD